MNDSGMENFIRTPPSPISPLHVNSMADYEVAHEYESHLGRFAIVPKHATQLATNACSAHQTPVFLIRAAAQIG